MKLAIIGATGMVGQTMLKVLEERDFQMDELILVASNRSIGKSLLFKGETIHITSMQAAIDQKPDIALFSAGSGPSLEFAPKFVEAGTAVIDNSSAWRMDDQIKLIVPEVNGDLVDGTEGIIANPNCSTIQMVVALKPLHERYQIKRLVIATYQSISGTGKKAVEQMEAERKGEKADMVYPHPIDRNVLPHCDSFLENDYTKEEMKLVYETRKIMRDDSLNITATCVRVPTAGGHSEAVNVEFDQEFELADVRSILDNAEGVLLVDNPKQNKYPMPILAEGNDHTLVGRLRRDESQPKSLNLFIVSDNLRKGAATNAVQIAELVMKAKLVSTSD